MIMDIWTKKPRFLQFSQPKLPLGHPMKLKSFLPFKVSSEAIQLCPFLVSFQSALLIS